MINKLKKKIKKQADSIVTNFHDKKIPKEKLPCKYLSIIILDSVILKYIDYDFKSDRDYNNETESDIDTSDE